MEIIIREASVDDAKELLEVYKPYVEETAISFEYEVPSEEEFRNRITNIKKKYPYLVAVMDGKIVGYAYCAAFKARAAYDWAVETTIYVRRDCKRSGIGRKLYSRMEEILKKQGVLNMNACIAWPNTEDDEHLTFDSIRFHEKLGYTLVGRFHGCGYKFDTWYDMVWMEKIVGEHTKNQSPVVPYPELGIQG